MTRTAAIAAIQAHLGIPVKILSPAEFLAAWPTADWTAFYHADGSPAEKTHPKMTEGDFAQACEAGIETSHGPAGEAVGWFDRERGLFVVCYEDAHPEAAILRDCLKHAQTNPDMAIRTRVLVFAGRFFASWFLGEELTSQSTIVDFGLSVRVWGSTDADELEKNEPRLRRVLELNNTAGGGLSFDDRGKVWRSLTKARRPALLAAANQLGFRVLDGRVLEAERRKALANIVAYVRGCVIERRIGIKAFKSAMGRMAVPVLAGNANERAWLESQRKAAVHGCARIIAHNKAWSEKVARDVKKLAKPLLEFDAHFMFSLR